MKSILIVDDERKMRNIYRSLLSGDGHRAIEASNLSDANDLLTRERIDLVLLDINMPGAEEGLLPELIKRFHLRAKVIVCSVRPLSEQKQIIKGALDYYDKSEGLEALRRKIEKYLLDDKDEKDNRC